MVGAEQVPDGGFEMQMLSDELSDTLACLSLSGHTLYANIRLGFLTLLPHQEKHVLKNPWTYSR